MGWKTGPSNPFPPLIVFLTTFLCLSYRVYLTGHWWFSFNTCALHVKSILDIWTFRPPVDLWSIVFWCVSGCTMFNLKARKKRRLPSTEMFDAFLNLKDMSLTPMTWTDVFFPEQFSIRFDFLLGRPFRLFKDGFINTNLLVLMPSLFLITVKKNLKKSIMTTWRHPHNIVQLSSELMDEKQSCLKPVKSEQVFIIMARSCLERRRTCQDCLHISIQLKI